MGLDFFSFFAYLLLVSALSFGDWYSPLESHSREPTHPEILFIILTRQKGTADGS
jgi:hypothetical protein